MDSESLDLRVLEAVRRAIATVDRTLSADDLSPDDSIVDDLYFDSLRFVDLTVAIEHALDIPEFPMQEWYDGEAKRDGKRFTLASLARMGTVCIQEWTSRVG
jgi:acyl carrier protein